MTSHGEIATNIDRLVNEVREAAQDFKNTEETWRSQRAILGKRLMALREGVESAGEDWWPWWEKNKARCYPHKVGRRSIETLLYIARADNPDQTDADLKERHRQAQAKYMANHESYDSQDEEEPEPEPDGEEFDLENFDVEDFDSWIVSARHSLRRAMDILDESPEITSEAQERWRAEAPEIRRLITKLTTLLQHVPENGSHSASVAAEAEPAEVTETPASDAPSDPPRKRGRPPGSKNRCKACGGTGRIVGKTGVSYDCDCVKESKSPGRRATGLVY
jgi:hypothetical protein